MDDKLEKTEEEWMDIKGYEGYYKISNFGTVKSVDRLIKHSKGPLFLKKGVKRKPIMLPNGYLTVILHKDSKQSGNLYVHRLTALHFVSKTQYKKEVNHIDGNKSNNRVSNLEWVTPKENTNHAVRSGLNRSLKLNINMANTIRERYNNGESAKVLACEYEVNRSAIFKILSNTIWKINI